MSFPLQPDSNSRITSLTIGGGKKTNCSNCFMPGPFIPVHNLCIRTSTFCPLSPDIAIVVIGCMVLTQNYRLQCAHHNAANIYAKQTLNTFHLNVPLHADICFFHLRLKPDELPTPPPPKKTTTYIFKCIPSSSSLYRKHMKPEIIIASDFHRLLCEVVSTQSKLRQTARWHADSNISQPQQGPVVK